MRGLFVLESTKDFSITKYEQNYKKRNQIVTLFMTTYKRPLYVRLAIESVLQQTYDNFYLIVLDNMSGDDTKNVVESFDDERVIYVEHDGNLTGTNIAYAFQLVKTKYIIVLHDDDIIETNYLETMISTMELHKGFVAISPTCTVIDSEGRVMRDGNSFDGIKAYEQEEYFCGFFEPGKESYSMVFPAVIYDLNLLGNINDYIDRRTGPAWDQFLWFEICRHGGKIGILGTPLIRYRVHKNQDSQVNAGILRLKLLGVLYNIDYYADILNKNRSILSLQVRISLLATLGNYESGVYNIKSVKEVYSLIPNEIAKERKSWVYIWAFKVVLTFPTLSLYLLKIIKKVRNHE